MSGYQGMRWFKCDLQVQTPEDGRHWDRDDPLRLPNPRGEQDLQEKARSYLRRCHEVGLEVIGVTDHNFCGHRIQRERFLAHLIEQNRPVAEELGKASLVIFPGFEVDIGFHVLCLFPPVRKSAALDVVCDVLTELGLRPDRRFNSQGPDDLRRDGNYLPLAELLRVVQGEHEGIVIAAHAFEDDGIAERDGRWAGDYRNEDLLCVEVSGYPLGAREKSVLQATSGAWLRRPPAFIQSSDAKSTLAGPDGQPKASSLGYRWTWIKMSEPSIEALRQAFLDPGSRIRQRQEPDPTVVRHDRVESLSVQGVIFLEDQEVLFSPHLNCLIGGRGSGKSSLFEAVRFALRREDDPAAKEQVDRIRATLAQESVLRLQWREQDGGSGADGPVDVFEFRPMLARSQVVSRDVTDPATVFSGLDLQIFSQREISLIAEERGFLLRLIDNHTGKQLKDLQREESELKERIRELQGQQARLDRLRGEVLSLRQSVQDLDRQWAARAAVREEQRRYRAAMDARGFLQEVAARTEQVVEDLGRRAEDIAESHAALGSAAREWPESDFFVSLEAGTALANLELSAEISKAAERYRVQVEALTKGSADWQQVQAAIEQAEQAFRQACEQRGLRSEDLEQLAVLGTQRNATALALAAQQAQVGNLEKSLTALPAAWLRLHQVWRDQTDARREATTAILEGRAVPRREKGGLPVLEARIELQGDRGLFLSSWGELAPDARTRLGRLWPELGRSAFDIFQASPETGSPWQVAQDWLEDRLPFPHVASDLLPAFRDHLAGEQERWLNARLQRVRDAVDLVLYHNDGTLAGSLAQRQLSAGQTNTAILMLLLASGRGPILIDQPEDELDSSFISSELVPLLRAIKNERQVIVVTHNPNLPVNADAELVYALQAQSVEGMARGVVRAQGGLDRPAVKDAVLDIMEGSEEAFRKRREKYHF
jgi:DNA repair ATPase RecN